MDKPTPCSGCIHFDGQKKFTPKGEKEAWYGWCKAKSIYPHTAPDGMSIPDGVKRAEEGSDVSKPFIVDGKKAIISCTDIVRKK